jgi:hypothetical protein
MNQSYLFLFFQFVKTRKMGGDEFSQKYLDKLDVDIEEAFGQYKAGNELKTFKSCIIGTVEGPIIGLLKKVLPLMMRFQTRYSEDRWEDVS